MRILFLAPWFPFPAVNGSKIRIYHLLRELSRRHEIHLVSFTRPGEEVDRSGVKDFCSSIETVAWQEFNPQGLKAWLGFFMPVPRSVLDTYSRTMQERVRQKAEEIRPDVLVASELDTARYAADFAHGVRILDDLEVGLIRTTAAQAASTVARLRGQVSWLKAASYVRRLLHHFDACTVVSEPEREIVSGVSVGYNQIYLIPNGVDVDFLQPGLSVPQAGRLIYNGSLTFNANYDAVGYFLNDIYPMILAQAPQANLHVTGSTQGVDLAALPNSSRATFTGFVPDIRTEVAAAWVCVVPLRVGGGTRLKILEAMALGTPVVATTKGAEGLAVTPGEDILIADTPGEFTAQVMRLFNDAALRSRLASQARKLVDEKYRWENICHQFEQVIASAASLRKPS